MSEEISGTIYDDVFRTMVNDCPELVLPLLNEMFGETYKGDEKIEFLPNEHFLNSQDGGEEKRITDSCFTVCGKKYHLECQSVPDSSMLVRIFEYDTQIALDTGELIQETLTVSFPHTGVLFLRSNRSTPDTMKIKMIIPGGEPTYNIAVMKLSDYDLKQIFAKNLLFVIPFYIFLKEHKLDEYEKDKEKLEELLDDYRYIAETMQDLMKEGKIVAYTSVMMRDMTNRVVAMMAKHKESVKEGVKNIMGGKVLNYEAKDIRNKALAEGKAEGILESLCNLFKEGLISLSIAAEKSGMSEEEFKKLAYS